MNRRPTRPSDARRRDARGLVLPSWLVAVSAVLVALAVVGFAVTGDRDPDVVASDPGEVASDPDTVAPAAEATVPVWPGDRDRDRDGRGAGQDSGVSDRGAGADAVRRDGENASPEPGRPDGGDGADEAQRDQEPVERRTAYVEVYNNSAITGLADDTATGLQETGWQVVATDNWYGDIPSNTVYYPAELADQAELLAGDLGVGRVMPAVAPMRFDRLTLILTAQP